jgi:hypothetical protein
VTACRSVFGCDFAMFKNDGTGQCLWSKTSSMTCPEGLGDGLMTFIKLLYPVVDGEWYVTSNAEVESNFDTGLDELNYVITNFLTCEPDPECTEFEFSPIQGQMTHTTGFFNNQNVLSGIQFKTTEGVYNFGQT